MIDATRDRLSGPATDANPLARFDAGAAAGLLAAALAEPPGPHHARFVNAYVQCADTMPARLSASGITRIDASASAAFGFFRAVVANQDANPHQATIDLLGAAFVVNRTAEGIDEIAVQLVGVPVTSVELMTANVLIHGALGDETGNTLDDVATAAINAAIVARRLNNAKLDPVRLHRLGAEERALDDAPVQCLPGKDGFRLPGSPY